MSIDENDLNFEWVLCRSRSNYDNIKKGPLNHQPNQTNKLWIYIYMWLKYKDYFQTFK